MDTDTILLLQAMWWGTVGFSYCIYGKRQQKVIAMVCGIALMAFPYFVASNLLMFIVGAVLSFIPWRWEL